jgi:hypothetical protein
MGSGDLIGGKHDTESNAVVYGTSDQGSCSSATFECQNHQIQRTYSRSEGNTFSHDGPTQILVC